MFARWRDANRAIDQAVIKNGKPTGEVRQTNAGSKKTQAMHAVIKKLKGQK